MRNLVALLSAGKDLRERRRDVRFYAAIKSIDASSSPVSKNSNWFMPHYALRRLCMSAMTYRIEG